MVENTKNGKFQLYYESITDRGNKKSLNEDRVITSTIEIDNRQYALFAVADGVGGTELGECASETAKEELEYWFKNEFVEGVKNQYGFEEICDDLRIRIEIINNEIFHKSKSEGKSMASTLSLLFVYENRFKIFHIGDSRIYRFRNGKVNQLTEDHSWVMREIEAGRLNEEEAKRHPKRHTITRALGAKESCNIYECEDEIEVKDVFLICSDGYYEYIECADLEYLYSDIEKNELRKALEGTLKIICQGKAHDNISAVLVMADEKKRKGIWHRA